MWEETGDKSIDQSSIRALQKFLCQIELHKMGASWCVECDKVALDKMDTVVFYGNKTR